MDSIRDSAKAFEPKTTKNVADLDKLDLSWPVDNRKGKAADGTEFEYKVVIANGEEYRIPNSVLGDIKTILEAKPDQQFVKVIKKGTGMNTEYTVLQV